MESSKVFRASVQLKRKFLEYHRVQVTITNSYYNQVHFGIFMPKLFEKL